MTVSAREGGQQVNVSEAPASGLQRRYKITSADAKPVVESATVVDLAFGWTVFPLDGQVNGKTGQVVTVVDCTVNGSYARAKGEAVLPAPLPSKPTGIQVTPESLTLRVGETAGPRRQGAAGGRGPDGDRHGRGPDHRIDLSKRSEPWLMKYLVVG